MQIHIIGIGVSAKAQLDSYAEQALINAEVVVGSKRQLKTVTHILTAGQSCDALMPLSQLKDLINSLQQQGKNNIAVLASGDPLFYGIGGWFKRNFPKNMLQFYPAISSVQVACHRLGLALQDLDVISLHGRALEQIRTKLKQNRKLMVLTDKNSQPKALAQECIAAGFSDTSITVCERLGYQDEKIRNFRVSELVAGNFEFDSLHLSLIVPKGIAGVFPEFPGIPDKDYISDSSDSKGMLTRREIRLAILSLLQPTGADCIWDIGAGCGGVAVELAYWNKAVQVYAVEHNSKRVECLQANRQKFGVMANLHIVSASAPTALAELPVANKVFIGGSSGKLKAILAMVWDTLPVQGKLVVSAVTENTQAELVSFYHQRQVHHDCTVESLKLALSKGDELAGNLLFRPCLPVSLFCFTKQ